MEQEDAIEEQRVRKHRGIIELSYFHLFWIFILVSIIGLLVETIVSWPIDGMWKNRAGLLIGPFSPIYGLGAVLLTIFLNHLDELPGFVGFIVASVFGGAFELFAGWFWEHAFGIVAWSYADQPLNIGGYTCLGISLVWGAAGMLWMHFLPGIVSIVDRIPEKHRFWVTAVFSVFIFVDVAATFVSFSCWFDRLAGLQPQGAVQEFFAEHFDNDFMAERFQTMTIWTDLAIR